MAQENVPQQEASAEWQAQYEFWTKIISDEVARRRFNEGFEPIDAKLYSLKDARGLSQYVGTVRICGRDFDCNAWPTHDAEGRPFLQLKIRVHSRKNY